MLFPRQSGEHASDIGTGAGVRLAVIPPGRVTIHNAVECVPRRQAFELRLEREFNDGQFDDQGTRRPTVLLELDGELFVGWLGRPE